MFVLNSPFTLAYDWILKKLVYPGLDDFNAKFSINLSGVKQTANHSKPFQTTTNFVSLFKLLQNTAEAYSEPSRTSKKELFARIVNFFQPLTIFAKASS